MDAPRPLVIMDYLEEVTSHKDDAMMRSMLSHLVAWCCATCYADGLADIVICDEPQTSWKPAIHGKVKNLHDRTAFKNCLKSRLSV